MAVSTSLARLAAPLLGSALSGETRAVAGNAAAPLGRELEKGLGQELERGLGRDRLARSPGVEAFRRYLHGAGPPPGAIAATPRSLAESLALAAAEARAGRVEGAREALRAALDGAVPHGEVLAVARAAAGLGERDLALEALGRAMARATGPREVAEVAREGAALGCPVWGSLHRALGFRGVPAAAPGGGSFGGWEAVFLKAARTAPGIPESVAVARAAHASGHEQAAAQALAEASARAQEPAERRLIGRARQQLSPP